MSFRLRVDPALVEVYQELGALFPDDFIGEVGGLGLEAITADFPLDCDDDLILGELGSCHSGWLIRLEGSILRQTFLGSLLLW